MRIFALAVFLVITGLSAQSSSVVQLNLKEFIEKSRTNTWTSTNLFVSRLRERAASIGSELAKFTSIFVQPRSQLTPQGVKSFLQIEVAINAANKLSSDFSEGNLKQDFNAMADMIGTKLIKPLLQSRDELKKEIEKKKKGVPCYIAKQEDIKSLVSEFFNNTIKYIKQEVDVLDVNLKAIQNEIVVYRNSTIDGIKSCNKNQTCVQNYVSEFKCCEYLIHDFIS